MSELSGTPRVFVIVLNWRRPDEIMASLESLRRSDYPCIDTVVVDNGSANGSVSLIRERFPEVCVIENGRNLGFAGGNNVGIRHAIERGADYVMLLNDDAEVAPDLVTTMVQVGQSDPRIGILGPKIYYHDRPNVIWSAGGAVSRHGEPRHLRIDEVDDGSPEVMRDVDYVTGCVMLVKRRVIERVGALDERFFAYFEETEWCARARRAGSRVVYVPQARTWHKVKTAAPMGSATYRYLMARNRLLYLQCSSAPVSVLISASAKMAKSVGKAWLRSLRTPNNFELQSAVLIGLRDFLLGRSGGPPHRDLRMPRNQHD